MFNNRRIIIDDREHRDMIRVFKEKGFIVDFKRIPVGDYIICDPSGKERYYFSLKSEQDLVQSVYNQHMHNEIYEMLKLPDNVFIALVVWRSKYMHGDKKTAQWRRIKAKERMNTINVFYLPVIMANDRNSTADVMLKYINLIENYHEGVIPIQCRRRVEPVKDKNIPPIMKLYLMLPGVGNLGARKLFEKYSTFEELVDDITKTKDYDRDRYTNKTNWEKNIVWYRDLPLGKKNAHRIEEILVG